MEPQDIARDSSEASLANKTTTSAERSRASSSPAASLDEIENLLKAVPTSQVSAGPSHGSFQLWCPWCLYFDTIEEQAQYEDFRERERARKGVAIAIFFVCTSSFVFGMGSMGLWHRQTLGEMFYYTGMAEMGVLLLIFLQLIIRLDFWQGKWSSSGHSRHATHSCT